MLVFDGALPVPTNELSFEEAVVSSSRMDAFEDDGKRELSQADRQETKI